jgi:hypothetical protein
MLSDVHHHESEVEGNQGQGRWSTRSTEGAPIDAEQAAQQTVKSAAIGVEHRWKIDAEQQQCNEG